MTDDIIKGDVGEVVNLLNEVVSANFEDKVEIIGMVKNFSNNASLFSVIGSSKPIKHNKHNHQQQTVRYTINCRFATEHVPGLINIQNETEYTFVGHMKVDHNNMVYLSVVTVIEKNTSQKLYNYYIEHVAKYRKTNTKPFAKPNIVNSIGVIIPRDQTLIDLVKARFNELNFTGRVVFRTINHSNEISNDNISKTIND